MTEPTPAVRTPVLCSPWATFADIPGPYQSLVDEPTWARVLMQASEILWALSGRRWYGGGCEETALLRSIPPTAGHGNWPYDQTWGWCPCWSAGTWDDGWPVPPASWGGDHLEPVAIKLPRDPVTAILSVTEGGTVLAADQYRLTRSGWLERLSGRWAVCGDETEIIYTFGEPPPEGGVQAVVALAVELARDIAGDGQCQLPQRVTSITRQGISMSMIDPMEFLPNGKTGLYLVDLWLAAVNPHNRPARGSVWSLDVPSTVRTSSIFPGATP